MVLERLHLLCNHRHQEEAEDEVASFVQPQALGDDLQRVMPLSGGRAACEASANASGPVDVLRGEQAASVSSGTSIPLSPPKLPADPPPSPPALHSHPQKTPSNGKQKQATENKWHGASDTVPNQL